MGRLIPFTLFIRTEPLNVFNFSVQIGKRSLM
ncbi:hypothetical protein IJ21_08430 [Paenibacillus sp. 32O-W]|jgi:hypothetical protein|nr:hypothetical protein IJ21_08430 [Paenibacillus sp. 32O-W]